MNAVEWDLPVSFKEYPTDEAFKMGAIGAFGDRYGDTVKVYQMGEGDRRVSFEICGGPHADHTGLAVATKNSRSPKRRSLFCRHPAHPRRPDLRRSFGPAGRG